jgi:Cysteine rich repeat
METTMTLASTGERLKAAAAALAIVGGLCAATAVAQAQQDSSNRQMIRQACDADYHSLCAGVQPGGGRIVACLQQNSSRLSPDCREALQAAKAPRSGT